MKETHEQRIERRLGGRSNVPSELPPMVNDTVYSNVLPVTQMPARAMLNTCGSGSGWT